MTNPLQNCMLCPRACKVDRTVGAVGFCGADATAHAARAMLHRWEEPCISGANGTGAVFFSHCTLGCVFCQNRSISRSAAQGIAVTPEQLCATYLSLQAQGAHSISLITATHYAPLVVRSLQLAKQTGLTIPILLNSGGYETVQTLRLFDGLVDIYLPDDKFYSSFYAARYAAAPDYREIAQAALAEMVQQTGAPQYAGNLLQRGTIIRHLMLPTLGGDTAQVLRDIATRFGDAVEVSLMRQYTPFDMQAFPELNRPLTDAEYAEGCETFLSLGLHGFFQQAEAISESFIPAFDGTGLVL